METINRQFWMREIRLVLLTIVFGMLAIGAWTMIQAGTAVSQEEVFPLTGWYYLENGKKIEITLPTEIEGEESLTIYNDSPTSASAGLTVTTFGAQYGLQISAGRSTIYTYDESYLFPRNAQMKSKLYCDGVIPSDFSGGALVLTYQTPQNGTYKISQVYLGTGAAVEKYHFDNAIFTLAVSFILIILAVLSGGVSIYLAYKDKPDSRFANVAEFLLLCSVWSLTDSALVQNHSSYPAAICLISFYAFMLFSVPMLRFVKKIGNMERYWILDVLTACFYANAAAQGILAYMEVWSFVQMLFVTHLLQTFSVVVSTALLYRECRKAPNRETKILLAAFVTVGAAGILSLVLYWLPEASWYGVVFEIGILIFLVLVLADTILNTMENLHYRTEFAVYQKLQMEDWMTGMQSRQPFEEAMTAIQGTAGEWENVYLIFFDINQLRKVNEEFGRAAGDSLVIGAARCIDNVYSTEGNCYRIGGDEFGVLVYNPKEKISEYFRRLDEEIAAFNRQNRSRLSVARGASSLRDEDGRLKPISDWKYEADALLYKDKEKEAGIDG